MSSSRRSALRIALIYFVLAGLWILLSDRAVALVARDLADLSWVQSVKGLMFITLSAGVIYVLITRELAARSKAEANLALLLDTVNEGVWQWHADSDRLEWNSRWWAMTGYEPGEVAGSLAEWLALVHPDDQERVKADIAVALDGRSERYESEHRVRRKDGTWLWLRARGRVVRRDADGHAIRADGAYTDITNLREQKQRLEQTVDALSQSRGELERFAFAAAHDLREPVRLIGSYAQLVERSCKAAMTPELAEYLQFLVSGAQRIARMLDGIQRRFEVDRGSRFEVFPLAQAVEAALAGQHEAIDTAHAHVAVGSLPVVRGDMTQMTMLFEALISNAIKFSRPDEQPVITIDAAETSEGHRIAVCDEGIGFTVSEADQLFLPFRRLHASGAYPGVGMGLAISRAIAVHHGGMMSAVPRPGGGASFFLDLPTAQDAEKILLCA